MSYIMTQGHRRVLYKYVKQATKDFDDEHAVEMVGFGRVYKGELLWDEGRVMCLFQCLDDSQDKEDFFEEVDALETFHHENILTYLGYSKRRRKRILVYKFPSRGSLDKYLSGTKLTWLMRLQICLDVAKALSYFPSTNYMIGVCMGDLMSANILLDENWQAKIANHHVPITDSMSSSTYKYFFQLASTPYSAGLRSKIIRSLIYSFGNVLFEVICGSPTVIDEEHTIASIGPLARQHHKEGSITKIIDPILRKQMDPDSLNSFSTIAYQCLEEDPFARPEITEVVTRLEKILKLQKEFEAHQQVDEAKKKRPADEDDYYKENHLEQWKIPFEDIQLATSNFAHCIGSGGFGGVYKAELFHFDVRKYYKWSHPHRSSMVELIGYPRRQSKVAVKRLDIQSAQGKKEFLQEIKVLPWLNHENLISLLGFCDEDDKMILIYDYASNGSLDNRIHKGNSLSWQKRLQISLDTAHGITYLHKHNILHRDMKSGNILLGHNLIAKIGDFGLSRISKHENSQSSTSRIVGTAGYLDPKYLETGNATKQSDIYSFGVILLELLLGRLVKSVEFAHDLEHILHVAKNHYGTNDLIKHIDRDLKVEIEESSSTKDNFSDSIKTFIAIMYQCLHCTQDGAPQLTIEKVVEELRRALILHSIGVEAISLEAIDKATSGFSEGCVIGKGASGKVYEGELSLSNGPKLVAIKLLKNMGSYGEGEFLKEVVTLSHYIHGNIIPLRGFCEERDEKIIILDHAIKGSLDKHLGNPNLTWGRRLQISIGTAKGLHYIHTFDGAQHTIHGDIRSRNILLDHDWNATISDFIIPKGKFATIWYMDPQDYSGGLTKESDVYSFGVVLFEMLSGMLASEKLGKHPRYTFDDLIIVKLESKAGEANNEKMVLFHDWLAVHRLQDNKKEMIIFDGIMEKTDAKSIYTFSDIAYQCLSKDRGKRPTMAQVLEALENAFSIHDEWESEKRLPRDYEEIIKMSRNPPSATATKKNLYSLLCSGIVLEREKVWFSISMDGVVNEMLSALKFSYNKVSFQKSTSNRNSRFSKVAKISDISNLNIEIKKRIQHLTEDMMYGAYLVFKFCDRRKVSNRPLYVNLKYKKGGETSHAYFAEWKTGRNWLMVELFRFTSNMGSIDFDVVLEGFSQYYCGKGDILIEGIEFQTISRVDFDDNKELKDGKNEGKLLKLESEMNRGEQAAIDYNQIIKRSGNDVENATNEELDFLLSNGILIDNGQKFFSLSKVNKKISHMLPAKAVLQNSAQSPNSSNIKFCKPSATSRCKFGEVAEIVSHQDLHIKCDVELKMFSSDTKYGCFLVFKLSEKCHGLKCPVKARDLLPNRKERTKIMTFTTPSTVNLDKIKWVPNEREDGWMEVIVWETISDDKQANEYIPMDLKLLTFEGTMSGLIVYGIEFRPI